jgi:hypothetical protein
MDPTEFELAHQRQREAPRATVFDLVLFGAVMLMMAIAVLTH